MGKMAKKNISNKKGNSKYKNVKITNKDYNRKVKKGKIKPKSNRSYQQIKKLKQSSYQAKAKDAKSNGEHEEPSVLDVNDMLEGDDVESIKTQSNNLKRDHTESDVEDNEEEQDAEPYEKKPRNAFANNEKRRQLLPLKNKKGLIRQSVIVEEVSEDENIDDLNINYSNANEFAKNQLIEDNNEVIQEEEEPKTFVDLYIRRKTKLSEIQEKIGSLCSSITENPEENVRKFKEMLQLLEENDSAIYLSCRKMAAISLVEVFKDILPSYQIRQLAENEATHHRLKKETRQLQEYEQSLLRYYKKFLQQLEKWLENIKKPKKERFSSSLNETQIKAKKNIALLALKCFSEILLAHPKFNMANVIIKVICEHAPHKIPEVASLCCETLSKLFKADKVGDVSFEAMKHIRRIVKMRNYNIPPEVLQTFLSLNVKEAIVDKSQKKDIKKIREKLNSMSRKERQHNKKMQLLEKELLEARAEESKQKKSRFQTDILEHVFLIYFHILKNTEDINLLTPVLEGLSKFSHLINIDFFDDLIKVLYKLIESGKLGHHEILHCLKTIFTILGGQGEALNIDPQGFYTHLYKSLLNIDFNTTNEDALILLDCVDVMLAQRRKKITLQRTLAFTKRISTISLQVKPNLTLSLLSLLKQFLQMNRQTDILLDPENAGSGIYMPELEDPEHCNANATCLWELHLLKNHFDPTIQKYSKHILMKCPFQGTGKIPPILALKSPKELYAEFEDSKTLLKAKEKSG